MVVRVVLRLGHGQVRVARLKHAALYVFQRAPLPLPAPETRERVVAKRGPNLRDYTRRVRGLVEHDTSLFQPSHGNRVRRTRRRDDGRRDGNGDVGVRRGVCRVVFVNVFVVRFCHHFRRRPRKSRRAHLVLEVVQPGEGHLGDFAQREEPKRLRLVEASRVQTGRNARFPLFPLLFVRQEPRFGRRFVARLQRVDARGERVARFRHQRRERLGRRLARRSTHRGIFLNL